MPSSKRGVLCLAVSQPSPHRHGRMPMAPTINQLVTCAGLASLPSSQPLLHLLSPRPIAPAPQGFSAQQVSCQRFLNLRYDGTDVPIMTPAPADGDFAAAFEQAYQVTQC